MLKRGQVNKSIKEVSIPLLVSVCVCLGTLLGISISTYQFAKDDVQVSSKKYRTILNNIDKEYADSVDIKHLFEISMKEMLYKLDPHSSYVPADDFLTKTSLDTDFHGVGIRYIYLRDSLFVAESIVEGPAYLAGVRSGDRILEVNDSNVVAIRNANTVYALLRGDKDSEVNVKIYRKLTNESIDLSIKRGIIPNAAVDLGYMLNDRTGYIKLNRFSFDAGKEIRDKIVSLKKQGLRNLILDLRDNGGGLYHEAVAICDEFLTQGRDIVFTQARGVIKDKQESEVIGEFEEGALAVLINENSASASEIVSGALQDNDRAIIVGRRSYGKGLVQTPFSLFDDSELRLTTSRYYTPSGRCIQKPYDAKQYEKNVGGRLTSGELFDDKNTYKNDSLKYHTVNMRTDFCGGGIYPDLFVAKDSSLQRKVIAQMFSAQCFLEFAILYSQKNKLKDLDSFVANFEIDELTLNSYYKFCKDLGLELTQLEKSEVKEIVKRELKIQIANSKWGELGMRKALNLTDDFILKSLKVFPTIDQVLSPKE